MGISGSLATPPSSGTTSLPALPALPDWLGELAALEGRELDPAAMIDAITDLERLKAAAAAAQARLAVSYDVARRESARPALKADPPRLARIIGGELALARRESPAKGNRLLGLAQALVREMPCTLAALSSGDLSEWRATLVVRETACLTREDRATVDRELADDLPTLGDRKLGDRARALAYRLDPAAALRRNRKAEGDRRVSLRPAPDSMAWLSALVPMAQGVAAYAALDRGMKAAKAEGDPRSRGQLMADALLARLTGADAATTPPIEIGLVMSEATLLRGSGEPAHLTGYGPIPAALARKLVAATDKAWVRRLYTAPGTGELVSMDSRRRLFDGNLRRLLVLRDQFCRNPWCGALIRHADHVTEASDGGQTTADNGQGLCEGCNYLKRDWHVEISAGRGHVVELTTWTRHRYRSAAPPLPGADPPRTPGQQLRRLLDDTG